MHFECFSVFAHPPAATSGIPEPSPNSRLELYGLGSMADAPSFEPTFASVFQSRLGRPPHKRGLSAEAKRQSALRRFSALEASF